MEPEHYRGELAAALLRIEQLSGRIALYEADPAHERVIVAEARLLRAHEQRRRAHWLWPRLLMASFAAMGAYAFTDPSLPHAVRILAYGVAVLGAASTVLMIGVALLLARETPWRKMLESLERDVRIARGDVGRALGP